MKPLITLAAGLCMTITLAAQAPVQWQFTSKKIAPKTYEIHLVATISTPWKIYSQQTPEGGPRPTTFSYTKNPLITIDSETKEVGELKKMHEEVFGVDVLYYKDKVEFVQVVQLKTRGKTKLSGSLEYMACNDTQCLPPATVPFTIALQ